MKGLMDVLSKAGLVRSNEEESAGDTQSSSPAAPPAISSSLPVSSSSPLVDQGLLAQIRPQVMGIKTSAYYRFCTERDKLAGVIADPVQLTKAALAVSTLSAIDIVRDLEGAHNAALSGVKAKFETQSRQQEQETIGAKQERVKEIDQRVESLRSEIARIEHEIAELSGEKGRLQTETDTARREIATVSAKVGAVLAALKIEIDKEVSALRPFAK